ncbi:MAG: hypothetical protein GX638_03500 [Crenarchaeota archaeon]|nr:hypothetical protein [Thermoproteota archaeon]
MRAEISRLVVLCLLLFLFQNGKSNTDESKLLQSGTKSTTKKALKDDREKERESDYSIHVVVIDSVDYVSIKQKCGGTNMKPVKVTDFKEAKRLLKGVVEFTDIENFGDNQAIRRIQFRNGKQFSNLNDFNYYFFVAYFPEEDILLCEGGHSTDISFDLKNGNETSETGNPELFISSPNNKYRLNGNYDGQQCNGYFIQASKNEGFEKIIDLEKEVKRKTNILVCMIKEGFWANDCSLFLKIFDFNYEDGRYKYLKIKIIEE